MSKKSRHICEIHGISMFKYSCSECALDHIAEHIKKVNGNKIDVTNIRFVDSKYKRKPVELTCIEHGPFTIMFGRGKTKLSKPRANGARLPLFYFGTPSCWTHWILH